MYVDAFWDRKNDRILVAERRDGKRILHSHKPEYIFYYDFDGGQHRSLYGNECKKFQTKSWKKFQEEVRRRKQEGRRTYESDLNPVFRFLHDQYKDQDAPKLNIGFFDIEVNFDPDRGFAPPDNPFNSINAISLYLTHVDSLVTLAVPPPNMSRTEAERLCSRFDNTFLFDREEELLEAYLEIIQDVDILSGWNSEGFDIPYMTNRIKRVLPKGSENELCLWGLSPREREYVKYKKVAKTYDLIGRVHLDYLLLYQKHNTQQQHSYRLDYIGEVEVGERKIPYKGSIDSFYRNEFAKFIEYNRQDTMLLVKIDEKKRFIELANQIAHANGVLFKTTMGSVALVETAIINKMHALGLVAPDREDNNEDDVEREEIFEFEGLGPEDFDEQEQEPKGKTPVVGAYVADPKLGLHEHVGCVDINSLYPSTIRALNISPETIVGQLRPTETMALIRKRIAEGVPRSEAWEGIFATLEYDHIMAKDDAVITVEFDDGQTVKATGAELYEMIFGEGSNLCISANGTIFRTDVYGVIPQLLAEWYNERKEMQAKQKLFGTLAKGFDIDAEFAEAVMAAEPKKPSSINIDKLLGAKDASAIKYFMEEHNLVFKDGKIVPSSKEVASNLWFWEGFWKQRQQARKILLNSVYGALLNEGLRFYDQRLGQSVTLTGRSIVRHMNAKINETITGKYDYRGDAIVYADTDSCYFSAYRVLKDDPRYADFEWSRENIIGLYDAIASVTNASFPEFMHKTFNTSLERGGIIRAGRELVSSVALMTKKKKYAALCYDMEGTRYDVDGKPGKLKVMGLDLKRADTPKVMQDFLQDVLMGVLTGKSKEDIMQMVREFRREFNKRPGWEKGTPKAVKALTDYENQHINVQMAALKRHAAGKKHKVNMPGHVRASLNWNWLCDVFNDKYSMRIGDGTRIVVCKLRPGNTIGVDSVAYPIDEVNLPEWFMELPFDHEAMETTIIDMKLKNLLGVLEWDFSGTIDRVSDDEIRLV